MSGEGYMEGVNSESHSLERYKRKHFAGKGAMVTAWKKNVVQWRHEYDKYIRWTEK